MLPDSRAPRQTTLFSTHWLERFSSHVPNTHDDRAGRLPGQPFCWLGPPAPPQLYARCESSCVWAILPDSRYMSAGAHVSHVGQVSLPYSLGFPPPTGKGTG